MEPLPADLNPGIVRTVTWLRAHGFDTRDSGDGQTHQHACDRGYAYVSARVDPARLIHECGRLVVLLAEAGLEVAPIARGFEGADGVSRPCIQGSYDPGDGVAVIDLMGLCDAMLPASLP